MSMYHFKHVGSGVPYMAVEQGDKVKVSWQDGADGLDGKAGYVIYDAAQVQSFLATGVWVLTSPVMEIANLCKETPLPGEELGTFRPVLETRKVGKVRVELVDDGFPLALREIAKVMTWAQTAKGYKDHDWQNLPDAQVQLAAAASRHRTDQIEQHVVRGIPLLECVDPESALVHKAHEAFGVLAQLELMLRERAE